MKRKTVSIMLVVLLALVMALGLAACNKGSDHQYTIVYVGDSIAEALIGPSPLSERDNYGYYALVGRTNGFKYYNHSISGHKTSTGIVSNEGLLEVINREDENAVLMKTHLQQADMIHISVLGNNLLQYNLGLLMLEVADPQFETKFEAGKGADADSKTLINALIEGSLEEPLVRNSVEKFTQGGEPEEVEFAFPSTYQDISDIVDSLKRLNPKATIVFQKVYNPFFEGSKHISAQVLAKLSEITDVEGRFGQAGEKITTMAQVRKLADYLLGQLNGILDMYLEEHPGAFITLDARAAFQAVADRDTNPDGSVNLSGDSLGRKLIYEDWTHPSNFGHAVIAGMTQDLLDELKVSSPNAVKNYKEIKIEQINRLYKNVSGFDADAAIAAINSANTYLDVTLAYFNAIEDHTPVVPAGSVVTNNSATSFDSTKRLSLDTSKTALMNFGPPIVRMIKNAVVDDANTYVEFTTDGKMHFQLQTKAGLFGELLDTVFDALEYLGMEISRESIGNMLKDFDIEGGVDSMVEPMFPGFKAKLESGDLQGALNIIENSLGFNIVGLDYSDEGVQEILSYVAQNMKLPTNLLDLIPADTVLTLTFDSQYYLKDVTGNDGKTYKALYVSPIGSNSDTQPFAVFDVTYDEQNNMKMFFKVEFMALSIGFTE